MKNRQGVYIRLNAEERSALEQEMQDEGWEKASTYIKYRLGLLEEKGTLTNNILKTGNSKIISNLLNNNLSSLIQEMSYYNTLNKEIKDLIENSQHNSDNIDKFLSNWKRINRNVNLRLKKILILMSDVKDRLGMKPKNNLAQWPVIDELNPSKKDLDNSARRIFYHYQKKSRI